MAEVTLEDIFEDICFKIHKWKDHPKEGIGRDEDDLKKFQNVWNWIINYIKSIENSCDELEPYEKDFVDLVKYEGILYRYHSKYNMSSTNYGVDESDYFVSFTKSNTPAVFYWHSNREYLRLSTKTNQEVFGIDLVGYGKFIQKHLFPKYTIGSPAIEEEKEVVFPLKFYLISGYSLIKTND